jgi:Na+-translocating ferredoxin:NAD+ oxidoreductase RnfC subunit
MGLVEIIREAGIVGAGGAGFPTHVKFNSKPSTLL